jgi:hypothetical protein
LDSGSISSQLKLSLISSSCSLSTSLNTSKHARKSLHDHPVVLPLSLCSQTPSKHVAQWAERREKTSQTVCRYLEKFCSLLYDYTA